MRKNLFVFAVLVATSSAACSETKSTVGATFSSSEAAPPSPSATPSSLVSGVGTTVVALDSATAATSPPASAAVTTAVPAPLPVVTVTPTPTGDQIQSPIAALGTVSDGPQTAENILVRNGFAETDAHAFVSSACLVAPIPGDLEIVLHLINNPSEAQRFMATLRAECPL